MQELNVRIVKLEPMHVAFAHAYGASPELEAMKKLIDWAKPKGLLDNPEKHRVFGYNNPEPSPGSPNYGYEYWMQVGPETKSEGEIKIKEFFGGLFAVTRCEVTGDAYDVIPTTWKRLGTWCEGSSKYRHNVSRQWLEENISPFGSFDSFTLDLYLPIVE